MNLFGIGPLEIAVVFLVAFLALGPGKSIEMARTAGKLLRDLRRTFDEVTSAVNLEEDDRKPPRQSDTTPTPPPAGSRPFEPPSVDPAPEDKSPPQNPP